MLSESWDAWDAWDVWDAWDGDIPVLGEIIIGLPDATYIYELLLILNDCPYDNQFFPSIIILFDWFNVPLSRIKDGLFGIVKIIDWPASIGINILKLDKVGILDTSNELIPLLSIVVVIAINLLFRYNNYY